ncbi:hypothetical protein EDB86DRAFT_2995705, partial [Lactarius hatsudake]
MPYFLRKFKHSQNLDTKDTPSLTMNSPSTIFSISQFFILIFRGLGRRANIISELVIACTDLPVSPSFPRMSEMFPSEPTDVIHPAQRTVLLLNAPYPRPHTQLTCIPALPTESAHAPPAPLPPQRNIVSMQPTGRLMAAPSGSDPALTCPAQRLAFPAAHPLPRLETLQRCCAARARRAGGYKALGSLFFLHAYCLSHLTH